MTTELLCFQSERPEPLPRSIVVAVDTEFHNETTLTVQAAYRSSKGPVGVQIYRDSTVPMPPSACELGAAIAPDNGPLVPLCGSLSVLQSHSIDRDLSPAVMLRDLLQVPSAKILSRSEFRCAAMSVAKDSPPPFSNASWNSREKEWRVPVINMTLVTHFQRVDLARIFGVNFFNELGRGDGLTPPIKLKGHKLLQFDDRIVQYLEIGGEVYALRITFRDTHQLFGPASLDEHAKTFLGIGKSDLLTPEEKADMARVFRERTTQAYVYAATDSVLTLLVFERMLAMDRNIGASLGHSADSEHMIRSTLGSRVSDLIARDVLVRSKSSGADALSRTELEELMARGGRGIEGVLQRSKFGPQILGVHGGLLYSRSPATPWHEAPGQMRDIDLEGFYSGILAEMNVYFGQPVVLEPGGRKMTLKEAVEFARLHADPDGWLIRASGAISGFQNVLIPSTENALTGANFRARSKPGKRAKAVDRAAHQERRADPASLQGGSARLYSDVVEGGVITDPTWDVIQLLPPAVREQYENLVVDTLIMYPRELVANDAAEYRVLRAKLQQDDIPWTQDLDLNAMRIREDRMIDHEFVSLRYSVRKLAEVIRNQRAKAKKEQNRGLDLAWKSTVNTIYGVLASQYHPTFNVVAANQVSARGRALAFLLGQSLNAITTITDGCLYRLDRIPTTNYAECLKQQPSYPAELVTAASTGIHFHDTHSIPVDDEGFNQWLIRHIATMFGTTENKIRTLFGSLRVVHKVAGEGTAFDAVAIDGAANYVKCVRDTHGNWQPVSTALRGFGPEAKRVIAAYLLEAYSTDNMTELPPLVSGQEILSVAAATAIAKQDHKSTNEWLRFPLGYVRERVLQYKSIKLSAFLFRNPRQRRRLLKQLQDFEGKHGYGLELLTQRRTYRGRQQGSITDLAKALHILIREGKERLTSAFNLSKLDPTITDQARHRTEEMKSQKERARNALQLSITVSPLDVTTTGIIIDRDRDNHVVSLKL